MNTIRIICRQSRLSLLQAEIVKQKIESVRPGINVEVLGRSSRGDRELSVPLSSLDGSDFFTEEIFDALRKNEADIAVHSLKDVSADHFFSHAAFAVVDRDDVRDVAIFNANILEKLQAGETIAIGTCSPRREEMAIGFLKKALPQLANEINIETRSIRGNVEGRLRQLNGRGFDATILATAGLNRLLRSEEDAPVVKELLKDKLFMFLPLIECVPAPCQGAIVAEAHPDNVEAVAILGLINDIELFEDVYLEKKEGYKYGTGCLQRFGVTTLKTFHGKYLYAAGVDDKGKSFWEWQDLTQSAGFLLPSVVGMTLRGRREGLFATTDHMKDFFSYEWSEGKIEIEQPFVFIANYKVIQGRSVKECLQKKTIWASGSKTWMELAKNGYWVQGSADGLGFEWLLPSLQMPLVNIKSDDICILTNREAAERWKDKGYCALSNYRLRPKDNHTVIKEIESADYIFWSSFAQYKYYRMYSKLTATHICAGGETASLLKQQGVNPVIFPTIKAFEQWRQSSTQPLSVA